jgi:2'-5' RNA ligase
VHELRSAIVVPVPEAAPVVDGWRERTLLTKPSTGVPAHVTLDFPFVPAAELTEELVDGLRELFAAVEPFEFELRRTGRFPHTLYLAPEPAEPFVALVDRLRTAYPDFPPYGGRYEGVVPHLTVAEGEDAVLDEAEADVLRSLPLSAVAREALLLEETEPQWARWETRAQLPFRAVTGRHGG